MFKNQHNQWSLDTPTPAKDRLQLKFIVVVLCSLLGFCSFGLLSSTASHKKKRRWIFTSSGIFFFLLMFNSTGNSAFSVFSSRQQNLQFKFTFVKYCLRLLNIDAPLLFLWQRLLPTRQSLHSCSTHRHDYIAQFQGNFPRGKAILTVTPYGYRLCFSDCKNAQNLQDYW